MFSPSRSGTPLIDRLPSLLRVRCETPHLVLPSPDLYCPEGDGHGFASGTVAHMFEATLALRYPD